MSAVNGYRILDVFPDGMDFMAPGMGGEHPSIGGEGFKKLYKIFNFMKDKPILLKPFTFIDNMGNTRSVSATWCIVCYVQGFLNVAFIDAIDQSGKIGFARFQVEPDGKVTYFEG